MFESVTGSQLLTAGSNVLSSALKSAPAGPSQASAGLDWLQFDSSGWTVATGKAQAEGGGIDLSQWALVGVVALVAVAWIKARRKG